MISVVQLGTVDYATGLSLQRKLIDLRKAGAITDTLLLLEHTPVITLGRNADKSNIVASSDLLASRGVEVFECDRGGDVTFHGPGQLVGYPIFNLREQTGPDGQRKTLFPVDYVRRVEEALIRVCADFGIATERVKGMTGVWTMESSSDGMGSSCSDAMGSSCSDAMGSSCSDGSPTRREADEGNSTHARNSTPGQRPGATQESNTTPSGEDAGGTTSGSGAVATNAKIAAIGVHISSGITSHGFALNVNTDLDYFDLIVPCGIATRPVTSMQKELGREVSLDDVAQSVSRNFGRVFSSQVLWVETLDALLGHTVGVPNRVPEELRRLHGDDLSLA